MNEKPTTERKGLSKSLRFGVFGRDQFACRYCGKAPPEVKLVVDHVIPVAKGGTNDETNLITSCESCNQGKSDKSLSALPLADQRRIAQENIEQIDLAKLAAKAAKAKASLRATMIQYFKDCGSESQLEARSSTGLLNLACAFGPDRVMDWISRSISHIGTQRNKGEDVMRYIYGIARCTREQEGMNP
jgi:hypothetical protein